MQTGDGLLARLPQTGALAPAAFAAICRAAARHGNGLVEVTARGSLQVRGLTPLSVRAFAEACAGAGIVGTGGPVVIASPLGGRDASAVVDSADLVVAIRDAVTRYAGKVAPKVSIIVDDGGALHLDALCADIRLRALPDGRYALGMAGDSVSACALGAVRAGDALAATVALLDAIATLGRDARARDLADARGVVAALAEAAPPVQARPPARFVGRHFLAHGRAAVGIGLAFGQSEAKVLETLAAAAMDMGATGIAPAPERTLLALELPDGDAFARLAARLGFITRADDPRRAIIACAGAPACAAALIPTRAMAAEVARVAAPLLAGGGSVHVSGCAKGCASRAPAALTLVGTAAGAAIIRDGRVGDAPAMIVPVRELVGRVAALSVPEPA